jgi:glutathione S-transferase
MTLQATLRLPSPNNTKIQIALAYKQIPYEIDAIAGNDPETIAKLVKLSGQPLTPILKHNDTVLYDSGAILRYIDANFDGPRLFSADRDEMKAIEGWEAFQKTEVMAAMRPAFEVFFGGISGAQADACIERANAAINKVTAQVEERLASQAAAGSDWLVGDTMTAADICVASVLGLADLPAGYADWNPLWKAVDKALTLGEGRERCSVHFQRVLDYIPTPAGV